MKLHSKCSPHLWCKRYKVSNLVEQNPFWEAVSRSASQEILHLYETRKFLTVFTRGGH
jgi:hypothetical protein